MRPLRPLAAVLAATALTVLAATAPPALAGQGGGSGGHRPKPPGHGQGTTATTTTTSSGSPATFAEGQLQAATPFSSGCGTNTAGEPAIHVSKAGLVAIASENGLGGGSDVWTGTQTGGSGADPCALTYDGQPNTLVAGLGASGGDADLAFAPQPDPATGTYRIWDASLNLASVYVSTSTDNGKTWTTSPVQAGLPVDDREWIAAWGSQDAMLTYHDIATDDIDVLVSTTGAGPFTQVGQVIPETDYKAGNNEIGNLVIDHNDATNTAYQIFAAPSSPSGSNLNEVFVGVSNDHGSTWTDEPISCSTAGPNADLATNFPNISVAPDGTLWAAWSDGTNVYTATSSDQGQSWTCSPTPVSTTTKQAIFPWLVATSNGVDLVYYGSPQGSSSTQPWYVEFVQNLTSTPTGWGTPEQVVEVHTGTVCTGGVSCTSGRQLFDDFGVDTDPAGYAHIAYSHDAPNLGGTGTYTGYAVQTGGATVGAPN